MPSPQELKDKFWDALKSDMTVMLALLGSRDVRPHPMTAQIEGKGGPIWFFSAIDTEMVQTLNGTQRAMFSFASKGHELFASVEGTIQLDNDRAAIDRLWNPYLAAWFEDGKDDPKLALMRFDPGHSEIWLDEKSLFAGIKLLLGADPKRDYRENVAEVDLS
jgi:general stress protein 26